MGFNNDELLCITLKNIFKKVYKKFITIYYNEIVEILLYKAVMKIGGLYIVKKRKILLIGISTIFGIPAGIILFSSVLAIVIVGNIWGLAKINQIQTDFQTGIIYSKNQKLYIDGDFGDFTEYGEYYFTDKSIQKIKKNERYQTVTKENIHDIYGYFENFEGWLKWCYFSDKYNFDKDIQINEGDFYYIDTMEGQPIGQGKYKKYDNYDVYYVDIDKCTIYFIHSNI